jgi:hypothetical protein
MEEDPDHDRPSCQKLEFITFTNPKMGRTVNNRRLVRSQAMRHVHQQAFPSRSRRNEIELNVILPERDSSQNQQLSSENQASSEAQNPTHCLLTILDVSRLDPFYQYPIQMGYHDRELYDHRKFIILFSRWKNSRILVYDETCVMFRTMRDIGFLNRVRQTSAFCQLLAMSSWHSTHMRQSDEMSEYLRYSLVATQELQKEINSSSQCSTEDAIAGVLAFACCAVLIH